MSTRARYQPWFREPRTLDGDVYEAAAEARGETVRTFGRVDVIYQHGRPVAAYLNDPDFLRGMS
jgi:hypothetical protein